MILAAAAILVGVFVAATGRGGELASAPPDHAPLGLGPLSPSEVAALRPPTALWGYNVQVTDEALERVAQALRDRDVTISYLQQRLAGSPAAGPATRADFPAADFPAAGLPAAGLPQRLAGSSVEATGPQLRAGYPAAGPAEPLGEPPAGEPGPARPEYRDSEYPPPEYPQPEYRPPESAESESLQAESLQAESSQPEFRAPPAAPGE
jgi:hypothetical protein